MQASCGSTVAHMEGGGFYNQHSAVQAAGISEVIPLWQKLAQTVGIGDEPLTIVDYASSEGRNSMIPMRIAIDTLRSRTNQQRSIEVVHTDLPSNDFSSLFHGLESDPDSYMNAGGIFPSAVGRSYFQPVVSPGRVHLGWNSWSLHWLSNCENVPDHIAPDLSSLPEIHAATARQQADDWLRFLEARSTELRVGGKILSVSAGRTKERLGWKWLDGELWAAVQEMGRDGLLSDQEQLRITRPYVQRSEADIKAPFISGTFAGLEIEHVGVFEVPDPHWDNFQRSRDAKKLGRDWCGTTRAYTSPMITAALDGNPGRADLVEELYNRFASRVEARPQRNEVYGVVVALGKCHAWPT